ncbi:MAG: PEGA domain-containing protein [Deltaproteobacteria bacterium]|nr:PEGA domain-containing protein [Deltaproteobacteria bacterium]
MVPLAGQVEDAPAAQMTRAVLEEFKQQQEKVQVVEGQQPTAAVTAPDTARKPARSDVEYRAALGQLKEGAKQAQKLRFPQAIRALRKGIDDITKNLDLLDDYGKLVDAYVLLAVSYFRKGQQAAGADVLETLARLRPEYELDQAQYPPVFIAVHNQARARALARPRGALHVTSAPANAEVVVNGRPLGATPILIEEVVPGEQHLVVKMGDNVWARVVTVHEGDSADVHANLGAGGPEAPVTMGDAIAANRFDQDVRKTARAAAKNAGADLALVTAMGMGDRMFTLAGYLGNVKTGRWVAITPVSPDLDLLSDSIEAHTLVRDVVGKLEAFDNPIAEDTVPFVAGKPVSVVKKSTALKEARAQFVAADLKVAAAVDRGPIQPVAHAARPPEVPEMTPPADAEPPATEGRRPIGSRGPVKAPVSREIAATPPPPPVKTVTPPTPAAREVDAEPRRGPVSRESGGRGPVVAGDLGIEIDDRPAGAPPPEAKPAKEPSKAVAVSAEPVLEPREVFAAGSVAPGASGPLANPDLEIEATVGQKKLYQEWWFWTAVAVGAVVVGTGIGGSIWWFQHRDPSSVTVYAVW